jgi:hypothetical protein
LMRWPGRDGWMLARPWGAYLALAALNRRRLVFPAAVRRVVGQDGCAAIYQGSRVTCAWSGWAWW